MNTTKTIPTFGYHRTKGAKIFELKPGERLPAGWADRPFPGQHPHDLKKAAVADEAPVDRAD